MKLLIDRTPLYNALAAGRSALDISSKIPIAGHVRLTASGDRLTLDTTDFDVMVSTAVPAEIERPGAIAVPANALWDLVRFAAEGAEIELAMDGVRLGFRAGATKASLQTLPADDYPAIDSTEGPETRFTLAVDTLARLLGETEFAISTDETRYSLYGTHVHIDEHASEGPRLAAVATNGWEMARSDIPLPAGIDTMPGFTVPKKTVAILNGMLAKMKGEAEVTVTEGKVAVRAGSTRITSKLCDGNFPDYRRVYPQDPVATARIDRRALLDLVNRVGAFATERKSDNVTWYYIELRFEVDQGVGVLVAASSSQTGAIQDRMVVDYDGEPNSVAVDPKRLLPAMKAMTGKDMEVQLFGRGRPIRIVDVDRADLLILFQTKSIAMSAGHAA